MKKWKCNISGVFYLICLKLCRLLELGKGISLHFKFRCRGNQIKIIVHYWKAKDLLFKQKWCSRSNLKQYSLIVTAGSIKFWRKMGDTLFLLWENNSLLFSFELPKQRNLRNRVKFVCSLLTACKLSKKSNRRRMRYCTFIFFNVLQDCVCDVIFNWKRG